MVGWWVVGCVCRYIHFRSCNVLCMGDYGQRSTRSRVHCTATGAWGTLCTWSKGTASCIPPDAGSAGALMSRRYSSGAIWSLSSSSRKSLRHSGHVLWPASGVTCGWCIWCWR